MFNSVALSRNVRDTGNEWEEKCADRGAAASLFNFSSSVDPFAEVERSFK